MKTSNTLLIVLTLILFSCKDDTKVEPVNIMEASPEVRKVTEKIAESEEEFEQKSEVLKEEIEDQLDTAQDEIEGQLATAKDEFEAKAAQVTTKVAETVEAAKEEMTEEITELLETKTGEIQRQYEQAQIQLLREQRSVSFDLMITKSVKDTKKFTLAMKYYALMENQIHDDSQNHERQTIVDFLEDTAHLFPKKKKLKYALRKDKKFNLYTLAVTANTVNPSRGDEVRSLVDMIVSGLAMRSSDLAGFYESDGIVARNSSKFIYFMQIRHNALYDAVISALGGNSISFYSFFHLGRFKVTGKGLRPKTVKTLQRMLQEADTTIKQLGELNIKVSDYKGRRKKLKKIRLDLDRGLNPDLARALRVLRDHIQKTY